MNTGLKYLLAGVLSLFAGIATARDIVRDGQSEYVIVTAPDAIPAERTAARELQHFVAAMTGVTLPVAAASEGRPAIFVGLSAEARQRLPEDFSTAFAPDEILLATVQDALILAGDRPRGTLYAVYEWLESHCGVRFWSYDATEIPRLTVLPLPELQTRYAPPFRVREIFSSACNHEPVFAARRRINGHCQPIPDGFGGHETVWGFCHTFQVLLPPERHFRNNPEWYAWYDGERHPTQPCLSHPQVFQTMLRELRQVLQDPAIRTVAVSQNDNSGYCRCPECEEFAARHDGVPSANVIDFVNRIAAALEETHPGIRVETLAYTYSREAPAGMQPRANVIVRLCSIECDFSQSLDAPVNAGFHDTLRRWHAIAPELAVWNYVTNFTNYLIPHPNWQHWADDLRLFAANGVTSVFTQDAFEEHGPATAGEAVELAPLRTWLAARLLWDPQLDQQQLTMEFLNGYYGSEAAPWLRRYLDLLTAEVEQSGQPLLCLGEENAPWLRSETLHQAADLLRQAVAAAPEGERQQRVRRAALPVAFLLLWRGEAAAAGYDELALLRSYREAASALGTRQLSEQRLLAPFLSAREQALDPPPDRIAPAFCRELAAEDWLEFRAVDAVLIGMLGLNKAAVVDDPAAVYGSAVRLPTTYADWVIQAKYLPRGRYDIYAALRREPGSPESPDTLGESGLYHADPARCRSRTFSAGELATDQYRYIPVASGAECSEDAVIYLTPADVPAAGAIYLDRFILVRSQSE